jgi:light-regulated signal transduction histidine kinase (bacteriophytochrome)
MASGEPRRPPHRVSGDVDRVPEASASHEAVSDATTTESAPSSPTPTQDDGRPAQPSMTPGGQSSYSALSDRQSSHQDSSDRVFPIRSVVRVDPPGRTSGEHDYFSRALSDTAPSSSRRPEPARIDTEFIGQRGSHASADAGSTDGPAVTSPSSNKYRRRRIYSTGGAMSSIQADAERYGNVEPLPLFAGDPSDEESEVEGQSQASQTSERPAPSELSTDALVTTRFRHVMTEDGHAVITGREGKLQRCEDEPIHTPGAVQGFGLLLAIREEPDGKFSVRYASENSQRIVGYSPQELFRLDNFMDILTDEQADNLLDHIDFIRDEDADPAINGPEVFSMSIKLPRKKAVKLWCAIHISPSNPDLILCEFELDDDHEHPLRPSDELTPEMPEDTLQANPTLEELTESTEILSKPLRVLRSARKRRGDAGAMQVFDIMSQVQEQLASAPTLDKFLKILVGIVRELTGFHRVMVYQFDSSFNGKVVTELVDPTQTRDLYKGLSFPASDIPKQARDLYKLNKVRLLYDRDLETARVVCRTVEDLATPLDMTHAYLRAMSPIHLKYLANMAVRASMSISINAFSELWGLIACHSYGPRGMRVSFPIRKMCRLVGDTASRNIERLSYASRLQARKLINTVPTDKNPSGYIIASSDDLLKLFDADFGMLSIRGETKILGKLEQSQEALAMLEYLRLRKFTSVVTCQDIMVEFPDLRYQPGFAVIAGLLYVPLSVGGNDFIVFFRKGQAKEVKWAGNPYEKVIQEGTSAYLEPRKSFRTWHETVLGKCREWTEEQVETAAVLCLVYGRFFALQSVQAKTDSKKANSLRSGGRRRLRCRTAGSPGSC